MIPSKLSLPMPAKMLIPHRPPMLLIDRLLACGEDSGLIEARLPAGGLLEAEDGCQDPVTMIELIAQGYGAVKGFNDLRQGRPVQEGFLVAIRKFRFMGKARVGDRLRIRVRTVGAIEGFAVAEGEVQRGGEVLATGTITLWIPEGPPA